MFDGKKRHKFGTVCKKFTVSPEKLKKIRIFTLSASYSVRLRRSIPVTSRFMNYRAAKQFIVAKLKSELSERLYYHGLHHTLDVLRVAADLCVSEGVFGRDVILVKTAALFHDSGFITNRHANHEVEGCSLVRQFLPEFDYTPADIGTICDMIMATKIPQSPRNLLEQILCDADLDYLGRPDFFRIGNSLYKELLGFHLIGDEQAWNRLQVRFLSDHRFHTRTNRTLREPVKQRYLSDLRDLVASYEH